MNQVFFVGRIVRPIDVKMIGQNHRVVNNTLAVSRNHRDKEGNMKTDFIPIIAWDHMADLLEKFCEKGQRIALTGRMQSRSYTNNLQQSIFVVECLVTEITLLDRLNGSTTEANEVMDYQADMNQQPDYEELANQ